MTKKQRWFCITEAIDNYIDSGYSGQPKVFLHPSVFNEIRSKPYKGCCFVFDERIPKEEFLITPLTYELVL